jgi:hypothetical protein
MIPNNYFLLLLVQLYIIPPVILSHELGRNLAMKKTAMSRFVVLATILFLLTVLAMPGWEVTEVASAQGAPADITETATEPASPTPTDTAVPPTETATPTATNTTTIATPTPTAEDTPTTIITAAPDTPTPTATSTPPPSGPVPIPEPVTVILFGTGLAALSAAVASRRKKNQE